MSPSRVLPGFDDPVHQPQQVFRRVLDAMSHPGTVHVLDRTPPAAPGLSPVATAVCLTLLDFETPLWLDDAAGPARDHLVFHCGVPITSAPGDAAFALVGHAPALEDFGSFSVGSDEHPETAATLILEVERLTEGEGAVLAGPGIRERVTLRVDGAPKRFWEQIAANHALFPRGIDLLLTSGVAVAALPRSVRVLAEA
jgi:alpha-D-ribose 1-methylphosphonate 5-triphosphate synthase subunit PhnH